VSDYIRWILTQRARSDAVDAQRSMNGQPCTFRLPLLPIDSTEVAAFRAHYVAEFCASLVLSEQAYGPFSVLVKERT